MRSANTPWNYPGRIDTDTRSSSVIAATRKAVQIILGSPDSRILGSDEICPQKSKVINEILARRTQPSGQC